jgi:hypothetical protein
MNAVIGRYLLTGLLEVAIAEKISMPLEEVMKIRPEPGK